VPDRIPVHWGVDGSPDRYGTRFEGLLILPLTALLVYAVLLFLPVIDPRRASYAHFAGPFAVLRFAILFFLAALQAASILAAQGQRVNMTSVMMPLMGGLFIVIGWLNRRLEPNWFVGIRTPWTLSSERAWISTHRVGSHVFIVSGLAFIAAGLIAESWAFWASMGLLFAGVVGLTAYSYFEWRRDPDKRPPMSSRGGSRPA
jgi:uncharacterized membrane protein